MQENDRLLEKGLNVEYEAAVYIGRFQPFHDGHLAVVKNGLKVAHKVIIIIGSSHAARNVKNPFTFQERKAMIESSLTSSERRNVEIVGVRDYFYNENAWITAIQNSVSELTQSEAIALLASYKDASSYYIKYFPQWEFIPQKGDQDATSIRDLLFDNPDARADWENKVSILPMLSDLSLKVPKGTAEFLTNYVKTQAYMNTIEEYRIIQKYKDSWKDAPFPPSFNCSDAIVVCSGHVLVVKRKFHPGKGLYAIPGGFIKQDERAEDAAIRELKEETGIKVDKVILRANIVDSRVFDHPHRSLRGRTFSHAFYIKLRDGVLPDVRGGDDASAAKWIPLMDVGRLEDEFFDDHAHIIHHFINHS